jgi:hypothetical protein
MGTMEAGIEQVEHELADLRARQKDLQRQLTEAAEAVGQAVEAKRKAALEAGMSGDFGTLDAHEQAVSGAKRHEQHVTAALEQVTARLNELTTRAGAMRTEQAKRERVATVRAFAEKRIGLAEDIDAALDTLRRLQLERRELGQQIERALKVRDNDYAMRARLNAMQSEQRAGEYVMRECLNLEQSEQPFSAAEREATKPFLDYDER